ncbi:MAG: N-acetylmuramoyl-L-alanine amidase [Elusimicrobiota bacterium]
MNFQTAGWLFAALALACAPARAQAASQQTSDAALPAGMRVPQNVSSTTTVQAVSTVTASVETSSAVVVAVSSAGTAVAPAAAAPELRVVWPEEGMRYPFLKRAFAFGSVTPGSTLTVNGISLPVRGNGAFLSMVDFSSGAFVLHFLAERAGASASLARNVLVDGPEEARTSGIAVLEPRESQWVRSGDWVAVRAKGPAGGEANFSVEDLVEGMPLFETSPGIYDGRWRVGDSAHGKSHRVKVSLHCKAGSWSEHAQGRVSILDPQAYETAISTARSTILKTLAGGYDILIPPGVQLAVTGRSGDRLRVSLAPGYDAWVDPGQVRMLPEGAAPPSGLIGRYLNTSVSSDSVRLAVSVERPVPFSVTHRLDPLEFEIRFFGAYQRIDRLRYASDDPIIREVVWRQEDSQTVLMTVRTRIRWSAGYDARYEKGRFLFDIRRAPDLTASDKVLKGRRVVLDPGHGPDHGGLGPLGTEEQDVNLETAFRVKALLEAEGAQVYLTRASSAGPALTERPALAWDAKGDVLVSIHHNALGASDDPFEAPRGFMMLYYHPQSRFLAESMQAAHRKDIPLFDDALRWGDLAVCRIPQMPAVLTESAYVMLPEQEEMLLDPVWQDRFAKTLVEGLRGYYDAYRNLQLTDPAERKAARSVSE